MGQTVPQEPQLFISVLRLLHMPLQKVVVPEHIGPHRPSRHFSPVTHVRPQMAQFAGSVIRFVHAPLHRVSPFSQGESVGRGAGAVVTGSGAGVVPAGAGGVH